MRDFLKYTLATVLGLLIFLGLSVGGLISLILMSATRDSGPRVQDKSILTFDLSTDITDAQQGKGNSLGEALSSSGADTVSLRAVLDALNAAAKDQRIVAVYLSGDMGAAGGSGYATLKEVREALQRVRAAGKKVIAYNVDWGKKEYYLASVADTIVMNPFGSFEMNGLRSETTFYAGALQKFGIDVQVSRVGKYKSAVEPFLLTKRSPASREQTQQLLGDLWGEFLTAVSQERKISPQQLQAIADSEAFLEPDAALKKGLVTKLAYEDEVIDQLQQLSGTTGKADKNDKNDQDSFHQISLKSYAKIARADLQKGHSAKNKIAVIYAEGEIVNGSSSTGQVGGDRFAEQLRDLRNDDNVKAVVLRINSPGGSVTASEVIQREVVLTRKVKPVVVSMGSVAASGGYWIATYGDRIFAEPNTITGSIGVFGLLPNVQKLANNNGVTWDVVKTARFADSQTISRPKSPQELAIYQKSVDRIYDQFLSKVAESRKLPKAKVAQIAQGRVWSGQRAKELGLVDALGGLQDALQDAAKRAKLGDDWQLEEYPKPRSLSEQIFASLADEQSKWISQPAVNDPVVVEFNKLKADLSILSELNDPKGAYARLPFNLRID